MKNSKRIFDLISRRKKQLLVSFILLFATFLFFSEVKAILVISALAVLGAFSHIYKRIVKITSAFEFVTFGTVIVAVAYGPWAGALFALAVTFAANVISSGLDAFVLIYLPVRILSGIFAAVFPFSDVVFVGIATTIFINLLAQPFYVFQGDVEIRVKGLTYLLINLVFNAVLFNLLGNSVLQLVQ